MRPGSAFALALSCALLFAPPGVGLSAAQREDSPGLVDGPLTPAPRQKQASPQEQNQAPQQNTKVQAKPDSPANSAPPRSDRAAESSSEQSRVDLSPPKADELAHPDAGAAGEHEWNPLRAMKDVEVGTYYYKAGNFKAAISRFREALQYKPRDAVATFKLAQSLEKSRQFDEARSRYQEYLSILSDGPEASEARKALDRLDMRKRGGA